MLHLPAGRLHQAEILRRRGRSRRPFGLLHGLRPLDTPRSSASTGVPSRGAGTVAAPPRSQDIRRTTEGLLEEIIRTVKKHYGFVPYDWAYAYADYLFNRSVRDVFDAKQPSAFAFAATLAFGLWLNLGRPSYWGACMVPAGSTRCGDCYFRPAISTNGGAMAGFRGGTSRSSRCASRRLASRYGADIRCRAGARCT